MNIMKIVLRAGLATVVVYMTTILLFNDHKTLRMSHSAKVRIEKSQYQEFAADLDAAMKTCGLSRFGADPSLSALYKREVFFINYRHQITDLSVFLTVDDILGVGTIKVDVYVTFFDGKNKQEEAMNKLVVVLRKYGGELELVVPESDGSRTN